MNISIREATVGDRDALAMVAQQTFAKAFGHSMTDSDLAAHLRNHLSPESIGKMLAEDTFLLACLADDIIGFVQFGHADLGQVLPVGPDDQEIRRFYVLAPYQNHGIGAQLMQAALIHRNMNSNADIFLDVWQENERAQRFYQRFGFKTIAEKLFHVESGAATSVDLIMVRRQVEPL